MSESWRESLTELAAQLASEQAGTQELITWAVQTLGQGADTPALRRLAGLYDRDPMSEARPWFESALNELKIVLPERDLLFSDFVAVLAQRVLAGSLAPIEGLGRISALSYARRAWDPLLTPLCDLQAAAELQADGLGSYAWLYPEFDQMPLPELIAAECQLFLDLRAAHPPPDLLRTSWCLSCRRRSLPHSRKIPESWLQRLWRNLTANPPVFESLCPHCGSHDLLPLSSLAGRRRYLAEQSLSAIKAAHSNDA
ncbi:MAG TPA: hypothetical protein V6D23_04320 [Candidatus Obscuribacterales bacterium]